MSKKARKKCNKRVARTPLVGSTGVTRRDVITAIGTVAGTVVGGEIVKYLPGPSQTPTVAAIKSGRTLKVTLGKPVLQELELKDKLELKDIVTSRIAFVQSSITNA